MLRFRYLIQGSVFAGVATRWFLEQKKWQEVITQCDEAIRLDPESAGAYRKRGRAYNDLGEAQRAIQDYHESIRLDPKNARTYDYWRDAYLNLDEEAAIVFDVREIKNLRNFESLQRLSGTVAPAQKQVLKQPPDAR